MQSSHTEVVDKLRHKSQLDMFNPSCMSLILRCLQSSHTEVADKKRMSEDTEECLSPGLVNLSVILRRLQSSHTKVVASLAH